MKPTLWILVIPGMSNCRKFAVYHFVAKQNFIIWFGIHKYPNCLSCRKFGFLDILWIFTNKENENLKLPCPTKLKKLKWLLFSENFWTFVKLEVIDIKKFKIEKKLTNVQIDKMHFKFCKRWKIGKLHMWSSSLVQNYWLQSIYFVTLNKCRRNKWTQQINQSAVFSLLEVNSASNEGWCYMVGFGVNRFLRYCLSMRERCPGL